MTSEEELVKYQLEQHQRNQEIDNATRYLSITERSVFIAGVDWADQHPRKGLWDSEKVTEWLENHVRDYKYYDCDYQDGNIDVDNLVEGLKKAMED